MERILVIEDDKGISELQRDYLEMSGYTVECAHDGKTGLERIADGGWGLVVLDLMLPGVDGMEILKEIGENKDFPIIVLSALGEEMYKVKALNLGADDYITKPFGMGEFVARVKRHIKLYKEQKNSGPRKKIIRVRSMEIDVDDHRVFMDGNEVFFTQKEFELVLYMAQNPNRVFGKEQLFERIWGLDALSDASTVTVHISKIREKIEVDPARPQYIETVWGVGYRFKV